MTSWSRTVVLALVVATGSRTALADPNEQERILANALFDEARDLMSEGRYAQACPKFAESMRLQPGGGTLLNLGVCHEKEGKLATAWGELKAALALARRDGRADREKLALERIAAVESRLSYVTIRVSTDARVEGLEIRLDEALFAEPSWESPRPIDPGEHQIVVTAPGYERFDTTFDVGGDGRRVTVDIPRLNALFADTPVQRGPILRGQHIAAIVAGGIGLVGMAFGAGFGAAAQSAWDAAEAGCPKPDRCTADGADDAVKAGRMADLSTVGFVVGSVGLALGAILFATGPRLVVEVAPARAVASMTFHWP